MLERNLTTDEILAKLDQKSKIARTISLIITLVAVLILFSILFLTYRAKTALDDVNNELTNTQIQVNTERDRVISLRKDLGNAETEANSVKNVISNNELPANQRIAEVKRILTIKNPSVEITTPTPLQNPQKTPNNANIPTNVESNPNNSLMTVYVQITDESQRTPARELIQKLRGGKFKFPGIELVERKVTKTQIRYFYPEDEGKAKELADKLGMQTNLVFTKLKAEKGLLEIWFSNETFK